MAFLLDTVTLCELRKKEKADPRLLAWQSAHPGRACVSVITLNEIRFGIRQVRRKDKAFAARLEIWYQDILRAKDLFRLISVDRAIAETAADLRHDFKMGYDDALIGATAQIHGLTLATRNAADFEATGVAWVNPWNFGE
jgi:predicted nucleic acid-binding protein